MSITIDKEWDGNERVTERRGRIYTSAGRWQWLVVVDGEIDLAHDLKREAVQRARRIEADRAAGRYTDAHGHQHAPCAVCGVDCSTHPDAGSSLDYCGDCGRATCPEHRDEDDPASRCIACAARLAGRA